MPLAEVDLALSGLIFRVQCESIVRNWVTLKLSIFYTRYQCL